MSRWGSARSVIHDAAEEGLDAGARLVFEASQRDVPTDTGGLKESGELRLNGLSAEITYGEGLPDPRAIVVHEKLDLHHDDGTAKYLENPTIAEADRVRSIIAAAIRRKL